MDGRFLGVVVVAVVLSAAAPGFAQQTGGACDRACLTGIADAYLAALVAHDPSRAPMAPNAKFTEQAQVLAVGEGLWKTAAPGSTGFRIPVPDPVAGQIGMIVMMKANLGPAPAGPARGAQPPPAPTGPIDVQLALRLKVQNRRIIEAEHIYARITSDASLRNLQTPRPALLATVPAAERISRELMLLIGNSYYDSIVQSDGNAAPYADDCGRRENGMHTAGAGAPPPAPGGRGRAGGAPGGFPILGCAEQMNTRGFSYIVSIDLRRVWIADEEKGLVFGLTMFRHPFEEKTLTILAPDGTTSPREMNYNPFDFESVHIFKIRGAKIHEIEAMGVSMPYRSKNGWSDFIR